MPKVGTSRRYKRYLEEINALVPAVFNCYTTAFIFHYKIDWVDVSAESDGTENILKRIMLLYQQFLTAAP